MDTKAVYVECTTEDLGLVSKADTHAALSFHRSASASGPTTPLDWTIGTGMIDRHLNMT